MAEATQTDPAMAGTAALSALSACAGGHAEVEIRAGWRRTTVQLHRDGRRIRVNAKSAVQQAMIRPILDVEAEMTETVMPLRRDAQAAQRHRREGAGTRIQHRRQDRSQ